jgi:CheY-like chemotaxis protein
LKNSARVAAEAGQRDKAQLLAEIEQYDLAILDINLQGLNVKPVAEAIAARKRPFFFLSNYGSGGVPEPFKGKRVLHKPCELQLLRQTIEAILSKPDSSRHRVSESDEPEADII